MLPLLGPFLQARTCQINIQDEKLRYGQVWQKGFITRWVALMIQLGKFVGGVGGCWVADTNYLYPARSGWINICYITCFIGFRINHFSVVYFIV